MSKDPTHGREANPRQYAVWYEATAKRCRLAADGCRAAAKAGTDDPHNGGFSSNDAMVVFELAADMAENIAAGFRDAEN